MLNSIIKIDLHIHSKASAYKEAKGFVDDSSIDNLDVLFSKLQENNINLFSITDHNRFDASLYDKAWGIIESQQYPLVKGLLSGVEFDVILEPGMKPCHIVTIFDTKNREDRQKIESHIKDEELTSTGESYSKEKYESLLKKIGLNTILIVHQKQSLDKHDQSQRSLSGSTRDPYKIIEIGYINALEYQKNAVEGILKNNLKKVDKQIALFTGSDCHQWEFYPNHNEKSNSEIQFTTIKSLPTFRGLLLALTSPHTRINQIEKVKKDCYIDSFEVDGETIFLDPGINAIVGENGSGKSTLVKLLNGDNKPAYIQRIENNSNINIDKTFDESKTLFVEQSEIVNKFNRDKLFDDSLFKDVDYSDFESAYAEYNKKLKRFIEHNIKTADSFKGLSATQVIINPDYEKETYHVQVYTSNLKVEKSDEIAERKNALKKILASLISEIKRDFYTDNQKGVLTTAYIDILKLYRTVIKEYFDLVNENNLKNIILNEGNEYQTHLQELQTSLDSYITSYKNAKAKVINNVISYIRKKNEKIDRPTSVKKIECETNNNQKGFIFRRIAKYSNMNVEEEYLKTMFVKKYQNLEKLFSIKTKDEMKDAVTGCTNINYIEETWGSNFRKFLAEMKTSDEFILDAGGNVKDGRTLGQISLTYYKYHLNSANSSQVVCIDQPEDNLSNSHIQKELIKYLNANRATKQLIIVTHNPLLVVNLDVDNVIKVEMKNGKLDVVAGCLEDDSNGILDYVAENMDGGRESIERRYRLYD